MNIRGVDFSGGRRPGEDIWITSGRLEADRLCIERCQSAAERFDETGRGPILRALRRTLGRSDGVTGLDVSFGLPAELLPDRIEGWHGATRWFATAFADADASAMRERLKSAARSLPGERIELKRRTDRTVGASSPYSFITYYQTLYGIREVLAPLVEAGSVSVPPMDAPGERNAIEVYPAGTLRRLGTVDTEYKNGADGAAAKRREILDRLSAPDAGESAVELPEPVRETATDEPGGDALDSVVAAVSAARAARSGFGTDRPYDDREGFIYV
ncbi:uncharacterized protein Nmlp_2444 [Natronomonas moolapensis 8.8.11]|uniref:DUF429 family protein n=1 Tax=Natronomonas moolapensis (strain DSM 18674 / CECT 7526 / JCM 14361 / 8.8.11) TaxID=268739 RepID=M1XR32_NATM8|nr:DUF429 domain-containing protein [Natronomonas moolapensis]CCQ36611.1 uncharacterized protein Nmlp_2444 [Natronomonas moolapensis 8.8.11]